MSVIFKGVHVRTDNYDYGIVDISTEQYVDGTMALLVPDGEGGFENISVNLGQYGLYPQPGCVFVKDYASDEGLVKSLVAAGVVEIVRPIKFGFGKGFEVRLLTENQ